MTVRSIKKTFVRNRNAHDPSRPNVHAAAIITALEATAADTIEVTFSNRVMTNSLPGFKAGADAAETVASMTRVSDSVLSLEFSGDVQGTDLVVQEGDGGIRTAAGGFVPAGTYAIPTFP